MYGLIGKMTATPGQRDALAAILLDGTEAMPGCLSYIIATDPTEPDALWITGHANVRPEHLALGLLRTSSPELQSVLRTIDPGAMASDLERRAGPGEIIDGSTFDIPYADTSKRADGRARAPREIP